MSVLWKDKKLRERCLHTVLVLLLIRICGLIPTPGVNPGYFKTLLDQNSLYGILNLATGNALGNLSVLALSISPYITATIIIQLLTQVFRKLKEMQKGRAEERKLLENITFLFSGCMALLQGTAMAWYFGKTGLLIEYKWHWILIVAGIWAVGSTALAAVGKRMTEDKEHFIGNGISLILLCNILSAFPEDLSIFVKRVILPYDGKARHLAVAVSIFGGLCLLAFTVFIHCVEKKIPVLYTGKLIPGKEAASEIPVKLCPGSVVPMIFASSILAFATLILQWTGNADTMAARLMDTSCWFRADHPEYSAGIILYVIMIFAFSFYYTEITINPEETADTLWKNGGVIPGVRAGQKTADYLRKEMKRMVAAGAGALTLVAMVPLLLSGWFQMPRISFLGSSLIIVTSVILETQKDLEIQTQASRYMQQVRTDGLFKKLLPQ